MIPVFKKLDTNNKNLSIIDVARCINEMQEEISECLMNLTSENITEISMDITKISSSLGSSISGNKVVLCGKDGGTFTAGYDKETGIFEFSAIDGSGNDLVVRSE